MVFRTERLPSTLASCASERALLFLILVLTWQDTKPPFEERPLGMIPADMEFTGRDSPIWSPDGKRAAFTVGGRSRVVLEGVAGPEFDEIRDERFSSDGRRSVYVGFKGSTRTVVIDGKAGVELEDVDSIVISADGKVRFVGTKGRKRSLDVDGVAESEAPPGRITLSPDDITRRIELSGDSPRAYVLRGTIRARRKDLDGAFNDFTKCLELNPKEADARANRANIYRERGGLATAIAEARQALLDAPPSWPRRADVERVVAAWEKQMK